MTHLEVALEHEDLCLDPTFATEPSTLWSVIVRFVPDFPNPDGC